MPTGFNLLDNSLDCSKSQTVRRKDNTIVLQTADFHNMPDDIVRRAPLRRFGA